MVVTKIRDKTGSGPPALLCGGIEVVGLVTRVATYVATYTA